jgi:septal ring factor EnvC (AmiA/AmiB activator)
MTETPVDPTQPLADAIVAQNAAIADLSKAIADEVAMLQTEIAAVQTELAQESAENAALLDDVNAHAASIAANTQQLSDMTAELTANDVVEPPAPV